MKMLFQNHSFTTTRCPDFVDVTGDVLDVVEESGVNGQVHAQLGDPAIERMPGADWAGAPQERVE